MQKLSQWVKLEAFGNMESKPFRWYGGPTHYIKIPLPINAYPIEPKDFEANVNVVVGRVATFLLNRIEEVGKRKILVYRLVDV